MKRYRIPLSRLFPATHPRKGDETRFYPQIQNAIYPGLDVDDGMPKKLHTIRENVEYWKKRIDEINAGNAVLEVYEWTGKPYCTPAKTLFTFDKHSGIGYQVIQFHRLDCGFVETFKNGEAWRWDLETLAKNDGLSLKDFQDWFKKSDLSKPKIIIHFTNFRY